MMITTMVITGMAKMAIETENDQPGSWNAD
jgi:hypothetical protein